MGAETRRVIDHQQADALRDVAAMLRPGVTMLIERLEPQWAAGFLAYYELESGRLVDLYSYMKETWGGKRYKLTALTPQGKPAWETRLNIAGVPLDEGTPLQRDIVAPAALPPPAPVQQQPTDVALFKLLMEMGREDRKTMKETFTEMARSHAEQTRGLVSAVTRRDEDQRERGSFVQQLGEVLQATQAIEDVRNVLAPTPRESKKDDEGEGSELRGAAREAMRDFFKGVIGTQLTRAGAPTRASAGTPARGPISPENGEIPRGVPAGQRAAK